MVSPDKYGNQAEYPHIRCHLMNRLSSLKISTLICALLMPLYWANVHANESKIRFERVIATGAEIRGNSVIQDRQGFIWMATQTGLARYDGYELKWYKKSADHSSISYNQANALLESRDGMIWIGTFGDGLNRYDPNTDTFTRYGHEPDNPQSLGNSQIWALAESHDGNIWVGTQGGISLFNRADKTFTNYSHDPLNPNSLSGNTVRALYEDRAGVLWVGAYGAGLTSFDAGQNIFTRYRHDPDKAQSLSHNDVRSIYEDRADVLWISTIEGGLNKLDRENGRFTHYKHNPQNPASIASNDVRQVLEDSAGNFWVISGLSGVSLFDRMSESFINYAHDPVNEQSIGFNNVYNILEERSGILFFFSVSGKIDKFDKRGQRFKLYQHNQHNPNSLSTSSILHIYEDNKGAMWFGGFKEGGLNRYDRHSGEFARYKSDSEDPASLKYSYPTEFLEDSLGNFWVSTSNVSTATLSLFDRDSGRVIKRYEHQPDNPNGLPKSLFNFTLANDADDPNILWIGSYGSGLVKFEKSEERFTRFMKDANNPDSISDNIVYDISKGNDGVLWIGTQKGGLCQFNKKNETFKCYVHDPEDPDSIGKGFITESYEDSSGVLWVLSYGSGLNRLNRETGTFLHYNRQNGFATNQVQAGPLEDAQGMLWMSTDVGILKFNPQTGVVEKSYNKRDGLQGDVFQYFSSLKSTDGEMWFGGVNGINSFYPEDIEDNPFVPPVYLTALTQGGENIKLEQSLTNLKKLNLDWNNNFFEFEFAALNFTQSENNHYKYMLEGLDNSWFDSGDRRFGRYSNIPGGAYTLRIKASNNDGLWSRPEQEVSVKVTVGSPFWYTWWFYLSVVAVLLLTVGFTVIYLLKLRTEISQRKQAEIALRNGEEKYRILVENTPDLLYRTDLQGRITFISPSVYKLSGYSVDEAMGMNMAEEIYQNPEERIAFVTKLKEQGSVSNFEALLKRKDGSTWWASTNAHFLIDSDGTVDGVEGITRDVTERKALQSQLQQSQKMEAMGTLAGGIAHDFNNILGIILGYADMAKLQLEAGSSINGDLDEIIAAGKRAGELVKQILAFSHQTDAQCVPLQPLILVKEAIKMLRPSLPSTIEIFQDLDTEIVTVAADPTKFHQIMMNLCTNAFHAMEEKGGRLEISLKRKRLSKDELVHEAGDFVQLVISDTGSGIPKEIMDKIFDPFYTTKETGKGTGMGLSIVHGIVKSFGGFITINSELGTGTAVQVYLPVINDSTLLEGEVVDVIPTGNERILFVDDEEMLTRVGKTMLEELGYRVTVNNSSREALELFTKDPRQFDLLITDQTMPAMTGVELARGILNIRGDIPILLCTGYSSLVTADEAKSLGITEFASKPLVRKELARLVRKTLDSVNQ